MRQARNLAASRYQALGQPLSRAVQFSPSPRKNLTASPRLELHTSSCAARAGALASSSGAAAPPQPPKPRADQLAHQRGSPPLLGRRPGSGRHPSQRAKPAALRNLPRAAAQRPAAAGLKYPSEALAEKALPVREPHLPPRKPSLLSRGPRPSLLLAIARTQNRPPPSTWLNANNGHSQIGGWAEP